MLQSSSAGMRTLALILSMTAPVPPGALVVHRGDFLLAAGLRVFLEDDDLGVLPAQFHHRTAFGIKLLDRERNGVHFLHELGANVAAHRPAAAARHENAALARP